MLNSALPLCLCVVVYALYVRHGTTRLALDQVGPVGDTWLLCPGVGQCRVDTATSSDDRKTKIGIVGRKEWWWPQRKDILIKEDCQ